MQNELKKIADALAKDDEEQSSSFYTKHELKPSDIHIDIQGVRSVEFPLKKSTIQEWLGLASKAKFGFREKTLLDDSVRDTYEIPAKQLEVTLNKSALDEILTMMQSDLGLPNDAKLVLHLHNLLIYGPGQFFKKHQDSEKVQNMVATLVMVLPSPHIGGDLHIEHNKEHCIFASENIDSKTIKCIAFYADCQHEIKKVTQGYRVALTYNVSLQPAKDMRSQTPNPKLEAAIQDYFDERDAPEPAQLVYFLNHTYTEHSLNWDLLKGADRANASSFYLAAQNLDLKCSLALVEIHESWTADGDENDPVIEELINEDTALSYWVDENNQTLPFKKHPIGDQYVCWSKETKSFEPIHSEYEGYMGNYGNTMDYWYRRAAVVLWRNRDDIAMNFLLNYEHQMQMLLAVTHLAHQEIKVLEVIKKAGNYLYVQNFENHLENFERFVRIALYIQNPAVAHDLLSKFSWGIMDFAVGSLLIQLCESYGVHWGLNLMQHWKAQKLPYRSHNNLLLQNVNVLTQVLKQADLILLGEFLLSTQIEAMIHYHESQYRLSTPIEIKQSLSKRISMLKSVLRAAMLVPSAPILPMLFAHVISNQTLYPTLELAELWFVFEANNQSSDIAYLEPLRQHVAQTIEIEFNNSIRHPDDWSISTQLRCQCEYCKIAMAFLRSKTEIKKVWPIVAAVRDHIIDAFRGFDLPVDLSVEKKGSPYKLVMVKNQRLHEEAKAKCEKLSRYCQRLGIIVCG